jgi:aspartate carbamoyltransferase catalytic subunit
MDEDHTVKTNEKYNITASMLIRQSFSGKVMHSLPRLSELSHDIDDTQFNLYYEQMREARHVYQSMFNFLLPGTVMK